MTADTPSPSEADLLPCPFCGEPARIGRVSRLFQGICTACEAAGELAYNEEDATAQWNTRSSTVDEATVEAVKRLTEALTPSADTKAAYMGEFSFQIELAHPRLGSEWRSIDVPWTTIKEIMAAIRARAAIASLPSVAVQPIGEP